MEKHMTSQELLDCFNEAIRDNHIHAFFQPQINHATSRIIGAEALMRWIHPEYGIQYPSDFIPVLEDHDLIYLADLHIFRDICIFQQDTIREEIDIIPISFNISRYDIAHEDYIDRLEEIRREYGIPVKYLRAEITESSAIGGMDLVLSALNRLHEYGYIVEMDDFGSGYSSLNVLKDLDVDVIKLDMSFLSGGVGGRGGAILNSILQMSKWLNTPVIAEGVETLQQADYMQSIGCYYIQGYLYSKPLPPEAFRERLQETLFEPIKVTPGLEGNAYADKFWNPESLEALIFNNFVGGAAIFSYEHGKVAILRVNEKYTRELGMNLTEQDLINIDPWTRHSADSRKKYEAGLKQAIITGEEVIIDNWRNISSKCCGDDHICIRSNVRLIGKNGDQYLFFSSIHNITKEKRWFQEISESERRFRFASEQANVYAWEVNLITRQMRPCFRCMRDLGLPAVVENYPEPAFESGIFPEDYQDTIRLWLKELSEGRESVEGVIPLTVGRVPFHVRYTTEFDENGKPIKAYGSATLVVDNTPLDPPLQ